MASCSGPVLISRVATCKPQAGFRYLSGESLYGGNIMSKAVLLLAVLLLSTAWVVAQQTAPDTSSAPQTQSAPDTSGASQTQSAPPSTSNSQTTTTTSTSQTTTSQSGTNSEA